MNDQLETIRLWVKAANACDDKEVHSTHAGYAATLGLPTLAALHNHADKIRLGPDRAMPRREVLDMLDFLLQVATGEAQERLRLKFKEQNLQIPGEATLPCAVLEAC